MEVTKLSSDKSEILVQLYDSLEDVLEKGNELDKKILEQMDAFNRVEKELSDLDKRFDNLKSNNVDNLTTNGAKDAGDIVREIISKKKEKQNLLDVDQILYKEYMIITNEIKRIQSDIDNVLNEEEIETLSTNSEMKVDSLGSVVHIKHTDLSYIVLEPISIENSEISETTVNIVREISRKFKLNEEETKENNNPHEMLINLYNSRNRQKEENEEFLNRIPKFIEKNQSDENLNEVEESKSNEELNNVIDDIDSNKMLNDETNEINIDDGEKQNIVSIDKNEENKEDIDINDSIELPIEDEEDNLNIDSNSERIDKPIVNENIDKTIDESINLNDLNNNAITNSNVENNINNEKNKIVEMPSLDLTTESVTKVPNIQIPISEAKVPTFEVPAPNISSHMETNIDVNNNVPLNEDEVNLIIAGNNIDEPITKEEASEIIINEPFEPTKIANSTEAKVQTILGVWSKYKIPKTVIKSDIKKDENVVPLDAILSSSNNSENTTQNNIQSFFSNAA